MFGSLLILLILPYTDLSRHRGSQFRPLMKLFHWFFFVNFFILMWIGSQHPETPFVEIGQFATFFYFSWFLIIVPIIGIVEQSLLGLISEEATSFNISKNPDNIVSFSDEQIKRIKD
jgi:quinol-cytochrome oxidoreductase complex cytochrome b subunit